MVDSGTSSSTTSSSQASPAATFVPLIHVASLSPFNPKEDPNTLAARWKLWKRSFNLYLVAKGDKSERLFRCNYTDHMARDPNCSTRGKKCNACGEIRHFAVCCKTKERKLFARDDERRNNTRGRAYQLSEDSATGQKDYYAFAVGVGQPTSGSEVDLKIGGVMLPGGKLKDFQLKLHIKDNVKPVAQPVRRLPFGLRDKVDEKLDELLGKDIIEEVSHNPTEWVWPLVVVPMTDGDIRICGDMRRANSARERERQPIPTIEEVLYDLNGSTVFSKLDLKGGFHQVELDKRSREITTFVSHRGLYSERVANMADDLIVHGSGIKERDRNLHAVLTRLKENGLTLNGDKCQFRLPKLTFFGHDLSRQGVAPSEKKVAAILNASPPQDASQLLRCHLRLLVKQFQLSSTCDGEWRAISYASRNLTEVKRRHSQTEKQALTLVWACERFKIYVFGRKFELETDHKPLDCIFGKLSKPSARIERWVLRLQGYDFRLVYGTGKANIADSLSRLTQCEPKDSSGEEFDFVKAVAEESLPVALTAKQIELVSDSDPELASLRQYILGGDWSQFAHVEGKNWREELQKFLLAYSSTPQTSTGVTPAFLMFGSELKTKRPELRCGGNLFDDGVRDRDWNHKLVHKEHVDNKRGATESPVATGDLVLLKNMKTSGKLEANFESEQYTVQTKEDSEVTVRSKRGYGM
ncbi:Uncharacterized protein K02A2.6 [Stylophora pistillata]|uniref:Uncharacterized protein K02A2.6 n=1 Tax=Stylophora pistillata TaxID=50429 RepID=A0A2B4RKT4_STYPI|nr:Uncharacterized protein K02A2.6 [Stylophora pistillata]